MPALQPLQLCHRLILCLKRCEGAKVQRVSTSPKEHLEIDFHLAFAYLHRHTRWFYVPQISAPKRTLPRAQREGPGQQIVL